MINLQIFLYNSNVSQCIALKLYNLNLYSGLNEWSRKLGRWLGEWLLLAYPNYFSKTKKVVFVRSLLRSRKFSLISAYKQIQFWKKWFWIKCSTNLEYSKIIPWLTLSQPPAFAQLFTTVMFSRLPSSILGRLKFTLLFWGEKLLKCPYVVCPVKNFVA